MFKPFILGSPIARCAAGIFFAVALGGCQREEIKSYEVPKETPAAPSVPARTTVGTPNPHATAQMAMPQVTWGKLPAGWTEAGAGQMSVASFNIAGDGKQQATVTITPLRGLAGKEALIVNMWRQQVGLAELPEGDAAKQLAPVEIGAGAGKMFDVTGKSEGAALRIVTAMQHRGDASWFFKLAGNDALVQAQKPAFAAFLKTIKISEVPAPTAAMPAMGSAPQPGEAAPAAASDWKTPAGWKSVTPGPMQAAKFSVPDKDGAKADVMVSVFPNPTGGTLGNVNRWRGQIGLSPVTDAELPPLVKPLDEKIADAVVADMANNGRRLVGAIVPRSGQWFFFKLLGDDAAVAAQKDAFLAFVKSPQ